jgi:hypothetical protein
LSAVRRRERNPELAGHRGDVDDAAALLFAHGGQDGLRDGQRAEDVDVELGAPLRERDLFDGPVLRIAGVVDEDVEAAGAGEHRPDRRGDGRGVGHVEGQRRKAVPVEPREVVFLAGGGENAVPPGGQGERRGPADAGRAPGEKDHGFFGHAGMLPSRRRRRGHADRQRGIARTRRIAAGKSIRENRLHR